MSLPKISVYRCRRDFCDFPPLEQANEDGLLAFGGDLSVATLVAAYSRGIFPWFSEGEPYLWWSPAPRMVLMTDAFRAHRSLQKTRRNRVWEVRFDTAFLRVIQACAAPRATQPTTWITADMQQAYMALHRAGFAHSVEFWQNGELVGGLYGVQIGRMFFGESMFARVHDASKIALWVLCDHLRAAGFAMIDCQVYSPHLASLGAREIARADFAAHLQTACQEMAPPHLWQGVYHQ